MGDARVARVRELKTALSETKARLAKVEAERNALLAHFELALVALRDFEQMDGGWKRGSEEQNENGGGRKEEGKRNWRGGVKNDDEERNENGGGRKEEGKQNWRGGVKKDDEERNENGGGTKCEAQFGARGRLRIIDGWNAILRCRNVSKLTTEDISRLKAEYLANLGIGKPPPADACGLHSLSLTPPAGGARGVGASPADSSARAAASSACCSVAANVPPTPPAGGVGGVGASPAERLARAAASSACCSVAANVPPAPPAGGAGGVGASPAERTWLDSTPPAEGVVAENVLPTPPAVGGGRSTAAPVPSVEVSSVIGVCGRSERERMESAEGTRVAFSPNSPVEGTGVAFSPNSPAGGAGNGHQLSTLNPQPPTLIWIVFDGPEENSYRRDWYRVTYTGGTGPHRADRLILDYVHAAKLLGLDVSRITVETADKALVKRLTALGAQVTGKLADDR